MKEIYQRFYQETIESFTNEELKEFESENPDEYEKFNRLCISLKKIVDSLTQVKTEHFNMEIVQNIILSLNKDFENVNEFIADYNKQQEEFAKNIHESSINLEYKYMLKK